MKRENKKGFVEQTESYIFTEHQETYPFWSIPDPHEKVEKK